jgi:hypothetical protein
LHLLERDLQEIRAHYRLDELKHLSRLGNQRWRHSYRVQGHLLTFLGLSSDLSVGQPHIIEKLLTMLIRKNYLLVYLLGLQEKLVLISFHDCFNRLILEVLFDMRLVPIQLGRISALE